MIVLSVILALLLGSYFAIQSATVQTYITRQLASYFSSQLHTRVSIGGVDVGFFNKVILRGVYIGDQHNDTLLYAGELKLGIQSFSLDSNEFVLSSTMLKNTRIKLVQYKNEKDLNFQFLLDLFAKKDTVRHESKPVSILCKNFVLDNIDFSYRYEKDTTPNYGINYSDIRTYHVSGVFKNVTTVKDTIYADIQALTAREKSGFFLKDFNAQAKVSPVATELKNLEFASNNSHVVSDLRFTYEKYEDYLDFQEKVYMSGNFKNTRLELNDIAYFAPELEGIRKTITFTGEVKGTVANLKAKNMKLSFGEASYFKGNVSMTGLPNIDETYLHLAVDEAATSSKDLRSIPSTPFVEKKFIEVPKEIDKLGLIKFNGDFTGFLNDFVAYGTFRTAIGVLSSDLALQQDKKNKQMKYHGNIKARDFDLGAFVNASPTIKRISLDADVVGKGLNVNTVVADIKGQIQHLEFNGYDYRNMLVEGNFAKNVFNGKLTVEDENISLDYNGDIDFTGDLPFYNFTTTIKRADLNALHLVHTGNRSILTGDFDVNVSGDDIDNLIGSVSSKRISYSENGKEYRIRDFSIESMQNRSSKVITLRSSAVDAEINGKINLGSMATALKDFMGEYLPAVFPEDPKSKKTVTENFTFQVNFKESEELSRLLLKKIIVQPNTSVTGDFNNTSNRLNLNVDAKSMEVSGNLLSSFYLTSRSENGVLYLVSGCKNIEFTKDAHLGNVKFSSQVYGDSLKAYVDWRNIDTLRNYGRLRMNTHFESARKLDMQFLTSEFFIEDSLWLVSENNRISIDSNQVTIRDFRVSNSSQSIKVDGVISGNKSDQLMVLLDKFNLANANPFLKKQEVTLQGYITGNASVANLYENPIYTASANISDLEVNEVPLGNGSFITLWNSKKESIALNGKFMRGEIPTIGISGFYFPNREKDNFDLELQFQKTQLKLFEKYADDLVSKLGGVATGEIVLKGTPAKPVLDGSLEVQKVSFLFNTLNTFYTIPNAVVDFKTNAITIQDVLMFDTPPAEKGKIVPPNTARVNALIKHNYFKDFAVTVDIDAKNLFCLNTTESQNEYYYGKAFATGLIHVFTDLRNTTIDIDAKTNKGTEFNIPLEGSEEISSSDFIRFVNKDSSAIKAEDNYKVNLEGIQMNFNLEVTPDAEVQLIFDSKIGDVIKASGHGFIKMNINTLGQFNIFGDYVIDKGDYLFTLKNVINKRFKIEQGSTVAWHGDPYDADINLTAIYTVRASLVDLMSDTTNSKDYSRRVPVDCKLKMTDKLMNPNIKFDIYIPNAEQAVQDELLRVTQNEAELNKQVFSLLLAGKFFPPPEKASSGTAGFASSNSSELLSNQLSNWLSQMNDQVNVGVKYKPGDNVTSKELQVALSTQLFNDRVSIDGNVGVADNPSAASNIVGDVNVEYKITKDGKLRVKAYNQSSENTVIANNSPNKQGVGLSYKEEFNTFGELIRRYKAFFRSTKKKQKDKETAPANTEQP